ncbi:MAG: YciI family protein [Pseudomonadota bacterium]
MQYIALIYWDEASPEHVPEDVIEQYGVYTQDIIARGKFKAGDALQPTDTATCIRIRDGKRRVIDGPFAETKEQLGGYYLLECDNLDDAIETAAGIPTAKYGTIEVRPIRIYGD